MIGNQFSAFLFFLRKAVGLANRYTDTSITALPRGAIYKGAVDYYQDLPTEDIEIGHTYTVRYQGNSGYDLLGVEYAWGEYQGELQWIPIALNVYGKADKVTDATEDNIAILDAHGNLADGGVAIDEIIKSDEKGAPNGIPTLNGDGVIPESQLPVSASVENMLLRITTEA
jgi:hypothetical protein